MLGLLLFRLYWGFFGSPTARFANFVRGPRAIVGYLRGEWQEAPGHNPLGALSVLALLGLLALQIALGLFAVDVDGIESGPLSLYVSFDTGRACAEWHETVFNVLMVFIAVHVLAVLYYVIARKQKLVAAMVTGKRAFSRPFSGDIAAPGRASWLKLMIGGVLAAGITWAVSQAFKF